jgi:hypothetical protein
MQGNGVMIGQAMAKAVGSSIAADTRSKLGDFGGLIQVEKCFAGIIYNGEESHYISMADRYAAEKWVFISLGLTNQSLYILIWETWQLRGATSRNRRSTRSKRNTGEDCERAPGYADRSGKATG